jgi:hypothetical protein
MRMQPAPTNPVANAATPNKNAKNPKSRFPAQALVIAAQMAHTMAAPTANRSHIHHSKSLGLKGIYEAVLYRNSNQDATKEKAGKRIPAAVQGAASR